jgi:hypothetical protein
MSPPTLTPLKWSDLAVIEQRALQPVLGTAAAQIFDHNLALAGQQTLLNIYYLMTHSQVAGDLWQYVEQLYWASNNQLGLGMRDHDQLQQQLQQAGFKADGRLTLLIKKSRWSWRQVKFANQPLKLYGLQLYRREQPLQQGQLVANEVVVDIDTEVFNSTFSFFAHAKDVLWPNKHRNDAAQVRTALMARGVFPSSSNNNDRDNDQQAVT